MAASFLRRAMSREKFMKANLQVLLVEIKRVGREEYLSSGGANKSKAKYGIRRLKPILVNSHDEMS